MTWEELDNEKKTRNYVEKKAYDEASAELKPVLEREEQQGAKPIEPLEFQPVRSPGIYEAEFAKKNDDLIFHFWPYGYHTAERAGIATPRFIPEFDTGLRKSFSDVFGAHRIEVNRDEDVGAISIKAFGWGGNDSYRKLAIEACEKTHLALGGS